VAVSGAFYSVTKAGTLSVNTNAAVIGPISLTNCPGTTAIFSTMADGSGSVNYQWTRNGTNLVGATNQTFVLSNVTAASAGDYCVVVSGACNSGTNCATLAVHTLLTAAGPVNQTNCPGATVSLNTVVTG